jgi:ABC-2 type transport system ATP-binding protein
MTLVNCEHVTRRFGSFTAVSEVSLTVGSGEILGLLGANGAGKTTLIRMLLGLLRPSGGRVELFGRPPSRATRGKIGYVSQGLALYEDLTVSENLAFAAAVFGDRHAAVPEQLRPFAAVTAGDLPLGVARRVAFAQALAHHPELLVLDEPTSGVDPLARSRLWATIRSAAAGGAGVIVTTHYLEEASRCSRLLVMSSGRVVAEGTEREIVGGSRTVVVAADDWTAALTALQKAGIRAVLSGTSSLRVPGAAAEDVTAALGDIRSQVAVEPSTLEERFVELSTAGPDRPPVGG